MNFSLYFQLQFENFRKLFYAVMVFAVVWIILCIIVILRLEIRLEKNFFCGKVKFLAEILLPILGHIGFLPIFAMLMNIFYAITL